EQLLADTQDVIDIDDPLAMGRANHIPQQHLAVFDRAAPEAVAVEMQQVEREIGEPLRLAIGNSLAQPIQMSNAALIGNGDLAIQNHFRQPRIEERSEGLPEEPCTVMPIATKQHEALTRKNGD